MEFTLDPAAMALARGLVADIADDLVAERATLDRSVSGLLGSGWSGVAADEYRDGWTEWLEGAEEVLSALHTTGELLEVSRTDYLLSDESSVRTAAPISSRLQERLS